VEHRLGVEAKMSDNNRPSNDSEETARPIFFVLLDDLTAARLMEIADMAHDTPSNLIASIVHDVLEEDALAHYQCPEAIKLQ
jgi:hypothetical protein